MTARSGSRHVLATAGLSLTVLLPALLPVAAFGQVLSQPAVNNPSADTTANDSQVATSVAASGTAVAVGWNDSGGQATDKLTGRAWSGNSGLTFTDAGSVPGSSDNGDPDLVFDTVNNSLYLATTGRTSPEDLRVFKSTDGGRTYGAAVEAAPLLGSGNVEARPQLAVDNAAGTGAHNVYVCWTQSNTGSGSQSILFNRSTDGASSFVSGTGTQVSSGGNGCDVVVAPNHAVYVFYYRGTGSLGEGGDNKLFVRKSTDQGATFGPETMVADLLTTSDDGALSLVGGKASNSFPSAAVNPVNGQLYVAFNDDPAGDDRADTYYVRSTNAGATWSAKVQVNNDDANLEQYQPAVAASTSGTSLMFGYYSTVDDPSGLAFQRRGRIGTVGTGGKVVLLPSFQLGPNTPDVSSQDSGFPALWGGRDGMAATAGYFHSTWSDDRSADSFHAYQPDVQYARVNDTPLSVQPAVALSGPASVAQGDTYDLRATVSNTGPNRAEDVFVSLVLPAGVSVRSVVANGGGHCYRYRGLVGCSVGRVPANGTRLIDVNVLSVRTGTAVSKATLTTSSADTNVADNTATSSTTVTAPSGTTTTVFSTGNLTSPIQDNVATQVPIDVSDDGGIISATVGVRLTHTYDADLDIFLTSPSGTVVDLSRKRGGSGDDYGTGSNDCSGSRTTFTDSAAASVATGTPPFSGQFRPEQPLLDLAGENPQGTWLLTVSDESNGDVGVVGCVVLTLKTN